MKRIKRVSLYEQVIESIQRMIQEGDLKVGEQLPTETNLANILGVSRNSVREALKALTIGGLIESIPGKGTFIKQDVTPNYLLQAKSSLIRKVSITELMEVRKILEVEAAGLAAERVSEDEMEEFRDTWEYLKASLLSDGDWVRTGLSFHDAISKLVGNDLLVQLSECIREDIEEYRQYLILKPKSGLEQIEHHEKIFNAIIAGDSEAAREAMREHLEWVDKQLQEFFDQDDNEKNLKRKEG